MVGHVRVRRPRGFTRMMSAPRGRTVATVRGPGRLIGMELVSVFILVALSFTVALRLLVLPLVLRRWAPITRGGRYWWRAEVADALATIGGVAIAMLILQAVMHVHGPEADAMIAEQRELEAAIARIPRPSPADAREIARLRATHVEDTSWAPRVAALRASRGEAPGRVVLRKVDRAGVVKHLIAEQGAIRLLSDYGGSRFPPPRGLVLEEHRLEELKLVYLDRGDRGEWRDVSPTAPAVRGRHYALIARHVGMPEFLSTF